MALLTVIAGCRIGSHVPKQMMRQRGGSGGERLDSWLLT